MLQRATAATMGLAGGSSSLSPLPRIQPNGRRVQELQEGVLSGTTIKHSTSGCRQMLLTVWCPGRVRSA